MELNWIEFNDIILLDNPAWPFMTRTRLQTKSNWVVVHPGLGLGLWMWLTAGRWSYHGGVESRHDRVVDFAAAVLLVLAGFNHGDDFVGVSGLLHVGQSRGPGRRAHQPHEGKDSSHSQVLKNTHTHTKFHDAESSSTDRQTPLHNSWSHWLYTV